ncbi:metallophosphoesterase family protein [Hyperthermus butylicus]|uniref:Diadenosine tetraphosphatase-related serine/threonine protein phosphatase n=1 Tax=Hyperthermus butylicus (strain DSM 5456 / JCM 9403 / PLM1-5) TaxID=415426 RepID=A2BMF0_HYPBU|nr:metallophosphoesterase family protein [Hyperthermus butylicus]ABM81161.1 diadenosine tetraphosphatase-related serine/threonine protein phosphatase [Hyperthermus butylicus DSM 5456]
MKILLISDIHGNADALKAVLENARGWDAVWVLGDLVDYGPEPHIVVDIVRDLAPEVIVTGNHDYAAAYGVDCRCAPEIHELSEYTRKHITFKLLSREQISWLRSLPKVYSGQVSNLKVYMAHGSPRNPLYGYLRPNLPADELRLALTPSMAALKPRPVKADLVVVGHTHIPVDMTIDWVRIVNPGSVGQPRDGDPRASYAILDVEKGSLEIRRVKYDINSVLAKLRQLGIEEHYFNWLKRILLEGKAYKET